MLSHKTLSPPDPLRLGIEVLDLILKERWLRSYGHGMLQQCSQQPLTYRLMESIGLGGLVHLSLLTMTNPNQLCDVLLHVFVCSKMADETSLSSKLPVADRTREV